VESIELEEFVLVRAHGLTKHLTTVGAKTTREIADPWGREQNAKQPGGSHAEDNPVRGNANRRGAALKARGDHNVRAFLQGPEHFNNQRRRVAVVGIHGHHDFVFGGDADGFEESSTDGSSQPLIDFVTNDLQRDFGTKVLEQFRCAISAPVVDGDNPIYYRSGLQVVIDPVEKPPDIRGSLKTGRTTVTVNCTFARRKSLCSQKSLY